MAFIAYPNARILLPVTAILIVPAAIAIAWLSPPIGVRDPRPAG